MWRFLLLVVLIVPALSGPVRVAQSQNNERESYVDEESGWSISWDPTIFTHDVTGLGNHVLTAETGGLQLGLGAVSTAEECLAGVVSRIQLLFAADIADPLVAFDPIELDARPDLAFADTSATYQGQYLSGRTFYLHFGCAPLLTPKGLQAGFLAVEVSAAPEHWEAFVALAQPVIDSIVLPEQDPIWNEVIDGSTYTDPAWGWSVTWEPERYEHTVFGDEIPDTVQLDRSGTGESVSVTTVMNSADAEVAAREAALADSLVEGYVLEYAAAGDLRLPAAPDGGAMAIHRVTFKPYPEDAEPEALIILYLCVPFPDGEERSVCFYMATTEDLYKSSRQAMGRLVETLVFGSPAATPVVES